VQTALATAPADPGALLAELGIFEIDLSDDDGVVNAAVVARAVGHANAACSVADQLLALSCADTSFADQADALARGQASVAVAHLAGAGLSAGTAIASAYVAEPAYYLLVGPGGELASLPAGQVTVAASGFFNPEAPQVRITWDSAPAPISRPDPVRQLASYRALEIADLVGAADRLFTGTLEYAKIREQFGRTIGSNQAVAHRLADLYVLLQAADALVAYTSWAAGSPSWSSAAALAWVRAAQALTSEYALQIVKQSFQLHGGISATQEFWVHRWARRAMRLIAAHGPADREFSRVGAALAAGVRLDLHGDVDDDVSGQPSGHF
jgi:hypothetical protein